MDKQQVVFDTLKQLNIPYEAVNHPAVYTIDEMDALHLPHGESVVKNLFLRDFKGRRHFLVVLRQDKTADLKALRDKLGCTPLSFASQERLMQYLGLTKGSVTPFGVLNDTGHTVEVVFDSDLEGSACIGVHPNENTATVFLSYDNLVRVITCCGNPVRTVEL
ncbi:prolyl-tRNA synthetase associated domain-containing protein [Acetanaerobacterium elongatum]|uniref:Ala-tRNA(Pro) hydrolase n=1 Tax=Acetanaerobacterium elongatum TaxID=258515 RepID=A0A1H0GT19_9FIRM|nr:prolyl-tRNA synthetase associated domain-containing protein [Acetanaerobacterium elongatum]SDO09999.1 Ala-tRNA(Pro) hydrolase [Acetanaerobacterium elongatum]